MLPADIAKEAPRTAFAPTITRPFVETTVLAVVVTVELPVVRCMLHLLRLPQSSEDERELTSNLCFQIGRSPR